MNFPQFGSFKSHLKPKISTALRCAWNQAVNQESIDYASKTGKYGGKITAENPIAMRICPSLLKDGVLDDEGVCDAWLAQNDPEAKSDTHVPECSFRHITSETHCPIESNIGYCYLYGPDPERNLHGCRLKHQKTTGIPPMEWLQLIEFVQQYPNVQWHKKILCERIVKEQMCYHPAGECFFMKVKHNIECNFMESCAFKDQCSYKHENHGIGSDKINAYTIRRKTGPQKTTPEFTEKGKIFKKTYDDITKELTMKKMKLAQQTNLKSPF